MAEETTPMEIEQEELLAIVISEQTPKDAEPKFYNGSTFGLPTEWTVEIRPRKASSKYYGKMDLFFYEPGTHKQFRSLKAVKKHLGLEMRQTSQKRKPKEARQPENLHEEDRFASKAAGQFENLYGKHKFASKATGQSENIYEKDKFGSSSKVADEDKSEESYNYYDKIAKRIKWQLINGKENGWDMYVKVPDAVQERWMDSFLRPNNNN